MRPLRVNVKGAEQFAPFSANVIAAGDPDTLAANIRYAVLKGNPELQPAPKHDGHMVIVGSSPSVSEYAEEIRDHSGTVVCVNGAHNWLIERGIIPDICVLLDPLPKSEWIDTKTREFAISPHAEVIYLIASQCDPAVLDSFKNVTTWHAWVPKEATGEDIGDILGGGHWLTPGGSTAAMRCLTIGKFIGFRRFSLYGVDSSCREGQFHVQDSMLPQGGTPCVIDYGGQRFETTIKMAQQADDFERLYVQSMNDCRIDAYGDGLIPSMCKQLNHLKYGVVNKE